MKNELALLKKENKLRTEFIPEEDRDMIRRMSQYISSRRIGAFDVEVTRKELIGMALGAMQDGESLQTVIGKDEKEFCDDIIENSKKTLVSEVLLMSILRGIMYYGIALIASVLLFDVYGKVTFNSYLLIFAPLWALFCVIIDIFIGERYSYEEGFKKYIPMTIFCVSLFICLFLEDYLLPGVVVEVSRGLVLGIVIVGGVVLKFIYDSYINYIAKNYHWRD